MDRREELELLHQTNGPFFRGEEEQVWKRGDISVYFKGEINSGGSVIADWYVTYIKQKWPGKVFDTAYEIGCGAGFCGFGLLAAGLCKKLVLSDLEPTCESYIRKTIKENKLEDKVEFYISDCLVSIPKTYKFDLVLATAPQRYLLDDEYPFGQMDRDAVRRHHWYDLGLKMATAFYQTIADYLVVNGKVLWCSFMPLDSYMQRYPGTRIYKRGIAPIIELKRIIDDSKLFLSEVTHPENTMTSFWIITSYLPPIEWEKSYML